jgi:hypothetical protein
MISDFPSTYFVTFVNLSCVHPSFVAFVMSSFMQNLKFPNFVGYQSQKNASKAIISLGCLAVSLYFTKQSDTFFNNFRVQHYLPPASRIKILHESYLSTFHD